MTVTTLAVARGPGVPVGALSSVWRNLTLLRRFSVVSVAVSLIVMVALGTWVSRKIEQSVIDQAAASIALDVTHFIAPHLQELAGGTALSPQTVEALDRVMETAPVKARVTSIKVWQQDGRIVYSTHKALVGEIFPQEPTLIRAWDGAVTAEFDQLDDEERGWEPTSDVRVFEVYAPIFRVGTDTVVAVAEFYQPANALYGELVRVKWQSWLFTALLAVVMIGALFSIVADGSRTIERQRVALTERISELSDLLRQNRMLRDRIESGARQAIEHNERFLRQIGSDLHDGPAQLVGLALLRLDGLLPPTRNGDADRIRGALADALEDIRNISAGLLLPESQDRNLQEALSHAIHDHERRTGTDVRFTAGPLPANPPSYVKICLCRFVQEGLMNAFRHAGAKEQCVSAWADHATVSVEVSDRGPGMSTDAAPKDRARLGLAGLRSRIESIGGSLTISSCPARGTRLAACLPLTSEA